MSVWKRRGSYGSVFYRSEAKLVKPRWIRKAHVREHVVWFLPSHRKGIELLYIDARKYIGRYPTLPEIKLNQLKVHSRSSIWVRRVDIG